MTIEIGQVIDEKYRIVRKLGEGGMGAVYEGENWRIRRRVAIKVLNPASASNLEMIARFEREAQAAGQIGNDHILEVLDLGTLPNGNRYMVLEYLDGETLLDRIQSHQRLTPQQVIPLARQVLSALDAAHTAGIIHRDLKPENIFILREKAGRTDFVKLIDFGVSKFANLPPDAYRVTRAGTMVGTPSYMAPEQARGIGEADVRSDIYAIGVILYEAVTGKLPFENSLSFHDLLFKIALSDPPRPSVHVPSLDPEFERIIMKAMARERDERYGTVQDLNDALEDWATEREVPLSVQVPRTPRRMSIPDSAKRLPAETQMETVTALWGPEEETMGTEETLQYAAAPDASSSGQLPKFQDVEPPTVSTGSSLESSNASESPFGQPRKKKVFVVMGAALGLLVLVGVGVAVAASSRSEPSKAVGMTAAAPPSSTESADPRLDPPIGSNTLTPLESPTGSAAESESASPQGSAKRRPPAKPKASGTITTPGTAPKGSARPRTPAPTDFGY